MFPLFFSEKLKRPFTHNLHNLSGENPVANVSFCRSMNGEYPLCSLFAFSLSIFLSTPVWRNPEVKVDRIGKL